VSIQVTITRSNTNKLLILKIVVAMWFKSLSKVLWKILEKSTIIYKILTDMYISIF